jgi:hypothetical protein
MVDKDKQKVIAVYRLPYFGKVVLLDDSQSPRAQQFNGAYWARVDKIGAVGRYSKTEEELKQKVSDELQLSLFKESKGLISRLAEINELLPQRVMDIGSFDSWLGGFKLQDD